MYKCNIDRLDDKINELNKEKERLLLLGKEKLSKIENGAKFGYIDFLGIGKIHIILVSY